MKLNKFFVLIYLLLVLVVSVGMVSATENIDDFEIDNLSNVGVIDVDDNIVSVTTNTGSFSDLEGLINSTSDGGTLDLDTNYSFNNDTDNNNGIFISKNITINGNGYTLDGKNLSRIFSITQSNVVINNLNFINGNGNSSDERSGGAIYTVYSILTVDSCNFSYCFAREGSAISCKNGDFTVLNSHFVNNSARISGVAIYQEHGNLFISGCGFVNNYIIDSNGKGCAICVDDSNATIFGSNFTNNYIKSTFNSEGGAIAAEVSNLTIDNCNFNKNYIDFTSPERFSSMGGAIYFNGLRDYLDYFVINNSNFTGNYIYSSDKYGQGGAVFVGESYETNITNCNFIDNYVNDTDDCGCGGAISALRLFVNNCNFVNNFASGEGGAIDSVNINVNNCNFVNNSANNESGAIASRNIVAENCSFINNDAYYCGGAICYYGDLDANFCSFINNTAREGGAIESYGHYINIKNSVFDGNVGVDKGKDIAIFYKDGEFSFDENYWGVNFTSSDEFVNADLISLGTSYVPSSSVAPNNWVLMSIYAPIEVQSGVSAPVTVKLDKLTDGSSVSAFTGSLPDYYTSVYGFTKDQNNKYNYEWDNENPDVGSFITNLWIRDGVGSFDFTPSSSGDYVLRTHSPFTNWEEAVTKLSAYTVNMSIKVSALNKTVTIGNKTEFKVIVTNTGNHKLTGVYIIEKSADDMVFDSWNSVKGDWVYTFNNGVHKWVLKGSLAPNETASFILVFNTTSVGNKTLVVIGGSNEIDGFSAENVTEVVNNSKPNPIKKGIPMEHTGTPLIAILFALITLPIFRRK